MHLRPYQNAPVEWLSQKAKALLVAPAGSGKTRMALVALQRFSAPEASILWLAHTREQIQQAQRAAYDVCPELNINEKGECQWKNVVFKTPKGACTVPTLRKGVIH